MCITKRTFLLLFNLYFPHPDERKANSCRGNEFVYWVILFTWVCTHPLWPLFLFWEKGVSGMTPMPYFFGFSFKFFPSLALYYYLDRDD